MASAPATLPPLVVRADASARRGAGHVIRCMALARSWQARGGPVRVVSHDPDGILTSRLRAVGLDADPLPAPVPDPADLRETRRIVIAAAEAAGRRPWIVVDGTHLDVAYREALRSAGARVLLIDDLADRSAAACEALLNQNIAAEELSQRCDPGTLLMLGPRYALLHPEFRIRRRDPRPIPSVARRILVTLGGSDPHNATLRVIAALGRLTVAGVETVVAVGAWSPHRDAVTAAVAAAGIAIRLAPDVSDMADLMAWADVAVAGGGTTCLELACLGLPAVLLAIVPDQRPNIEALAKAGAAVAGGEASLVTSDDLAMRLDALCRDPDERRELSARSQRLVDGAGADRVVSLLAGLEAVPA